MNFERTLKHDHIELSTRDRLFWDLRTWVLKKRESGDGYELALEAETSRSDTITRLNVSP